MRWCKSISSYGLKPLTRQRQSLNHTKPQIMSFALDVERLSEILEDVEKTIYAFHKWRNVTSEDDYLETEDTPLGSIIES